LGGLFGVNLHTKQIQTIWSPLCVARPVHNATAAEGRAARLNERKLSCKPVAFIHVDGHTQRPVPIVEVARAPLSLMLLQLLLLLLPPLSLSLQHRLVAEEARPN
jgi:hypothetical protein